MQHRSMQPNLAFAMLQAATHQNPVSVFDRLVARPMQIRRYAWMLDPSGRPYGGGGVAIGARDFIKFGQLMLNGGTWHGHRILDNGFVKAAASPQYHLRNVCYGYLWWVGDYPYKNRTVRSYSARGAEETSCSSFPNWTWSSKRWAGIIRTDAEAGF